MDLRIGETREEVPFPHPLLARCASGHGGERWGWRGDSEHGGKNKRRDVNEIKRVRGMYLGGVVGHD